MMVTACLITYGKERRENVGRIVSRLLECSFVGEILIHDNAKGPNLKTYARYLLAARAANSVVFTQDDDCLLSVPDLETLYECYRQTPDRITFGLAPTHYPLWARGVFTFGTAMLAMMGWGAFFSRAWIPVAFDRYIKRWGLADPLLYREADRIFAVALNRHHSYLSVAVEHLSGATGSGAMASEPDHWATRDQAIQRALALACR